MKTNDIFVFKRYEVKYMLSLSQYEKIINVITSYLLSDIHGKSTIQSLYYDTDNFKIIRDSIDAKSYKEKLRLRCYNKNIDNKVFLELKKKYNGVVFKRRISLSEDEAITYLANANAKYNDSQIAKEIDYFKKLYGSLKPKVLLLYDRMAYFDLNSDLRITFDNNIRYRTSDFSLKNDLVGKPLFDNSKYYLMEIKTGVAMPLWLSNILNENKIYPCSFSKYKNVYAKEYLNHVWFYF